MDQIDIGNPSLIEEYKKFVCKLLERPRKLHKKKLLSLCLCIVIDVIEYRLHLVAKTGCLIFVLS